MEAEDAFVCPPPPGPPPLLSENQLLHLARQGWLTFDLPDDLTETVADLFTTSADFFSIPNEEKVASYPAKSGTEFGYYSVPEEKEYITFRCRVQTASSSPSQRNLLFQKLEDTAAKAWEQSGTLLYRILCDLARWSDLDPSVWDAILDGTLSMPDSESQMTYTLLRLFKYLPTTGLAEKHTDLGLLTMCIGSRSGLEVVDQIESINKDPVWVCPSRDARTATILIGNTLRALSDDIFKSGVHRVVGNSEGRDSVVFTLRHSSRHDVDFNLFGGEGRVSASELWKFLKVGKVNINMVKEMREAQRAQLRQSIEKSNGEVSIGHG
ncbi:hypothetical protein H2200_005935 [Cladophialophora chaetospira]|uniref:Isopenicillin N synthase-like Fe(2+) 2OG dioxygenase domain-containing protein n=1 Tax=Cladophialophora chaetospira TaxID=386627 RepID=A0AA38X9Z9_9EURO|nr:hypothetical protein H2200_005935 [Cladophialophora chaetospira]